MTLPSSFRAAMGVGEGSMVELSLKNGKTVITSTVVIDRSQFPNADDEYTPPQRRVMDARLGKPAKDFKAGRFHGSLHSKRSQRLYRAPGQGASKQPNKLSLRIDEDYFDRLRLDCDR